MKTKGHRCALDKMAPEAVGQAAEMLNQMRRMGLLKAERRDKAVWYSMADARPIALLNCIRTCCDRNG